MSSAVTDANFDKRIQIDCPIVVVFWQRNCAPCKALVPELIETAKERKGVQFVLMNAVDNPKTKTRFNVDACPTMMVFRNGNTLGRWLGAIPKDKILKWIDRTVANA